MFLCVVVVVLIVRVFVYAFYASALPTSLIARNLDGHEALYRRKFSFDAHVRPRTLRLDHLERQVDLLQLWLCFMSWLSDKIFVFGISNLQTSAELPVPFISIHVQNTLFLQWTCADIISTHRQ